MVQRLRVVQSLWRRPVPQDISVSRPGRPRRETLRTAYVVLKSISRKVRESTSTAEHIVDNLRLWIRNPLGIEQHRNAGDGDDR